MKNLKNRLKAAWAAFNNPIAMSIGESDMKMAKYLDEHGMRAIASPLCPDDGHEFLVFKLLSHDDDEAIKWGLDI